MSNLEELAEKYYNPQKEEGYTYLMEFIFQTKNGTKTLYKVGVTQNKPVDRMLEIARSFWTQRQYVPECRLVRYRKSASFREKEKAIHTELAEYKYPFKIKFSGYTEFFDADLQAIIYVYENACPKISKDLRI